MTENNHILTGLSDQEVKQSREAHGINVLTPPKRKPMWMLYLEKFEDPVIRILLVAACFSLAISIFENEYAETIGIIAAILLATGVGFLFEYDANRKFDMLNTVNDDNAVRVIRNGHVCEIPRKDVVVGDIVLLETGEEVPADGELLEAISLLVNESSLTGEPSASKTTDEAHFHKDATYADNMVMRGTTVLDGHGMMKVLSVGDATEIGKVARQSSEETHEETPLNQQLDKLAKLIGNVGFTVAGQRHFADIHDGSHVDCDGCTRRLAHECDTELGTEYATHAYYQQSSQKDARLRNDGCHQCNLHRQDRHLDAKSNAGARSLFLGFAKREQTKWQRSKCFGKRRY